MISINEILGSTPIAPAIPSTADQIFLPGGHLEKALKLEHRPQQEAMAKAISKALEYNSSVLFEAGTGVGKSLAYLIPGIIESIDQKRPFLVSTHTKALQEQLESKDLPICRTLFNSVPKLKKYAEFKTAMLMGRGNYLCTTRLMQAIASRIELFPSEQQEDLERIAEWSAITETGLIEELNPAPSFEVWDWVNADSSTCSKKHCNSNDCFYQKAKAKLQNANLIILNHSLLFSLISAGMTPGRDVQGVLFPEDFLVLDEAHTIAEIATSHFGHRISSYAVDRALKMLYNPKRKKGLLTRFGKKADCYKVVAALGASEEFFNAINQKHLRKNDLVRLLEPDWAEPILSSPLKAVIDSLALMEAYEQNEANGKLIQDHRKRLQGYYDGIHQCLAVEPKEHVFWLEKSGRQGQITAIRTAPIDVAPYLRENLFNRNTSVLLTSATLATGRSMENFQKRIGAEGEEEFIENSPFDYDKNVRIYIASDAPAPTAREARLNRDYLTDRIRFCIERVEGGTLVLFTSYADLLAVGKDLDPILEDMGRPLFVQGNGTSRTKLVQDFRAAGNGVLLGTDSFWTGIDVPGSALSQVILTRLPFENPSHPIKMAQSEWIVARGGQPFSERTIPDAIIKFRQGLGRLIRKKTDKGVITILDSRILHKEYGRAFISALPKKSFERFDDSNKEVVFSNHIKAEKEQALGPDGTTLREGIGPAY